MVGEVVGLEEGFAVGEVVGLKEGAGVYIQVVMNCVTFSI